MFESAELVENLPRLRRYARALVLDPSQADDLVQDSVLRAWEKRHQYSTGTNLRAWLFTVMHNVYVNKIRRAGLESSLIREQDLTNQDPPGAPDIDPIALSDVENALEQLPSEQREVLLLAGLEQMSYKDIATALDIPLGTVMSRLSRAREQLRRILPNPQILHAVSVTDP